MQYTLKRAVTAASERFNDSLDELETEIQQAQAVLRRDLALLQADRKKREAAAKEKEAEKARLAAESSAKKNAPVKKESSLPAAPSAKPDAPGPSKPPAEQPTEPRALTREQEDARPPVATASASAQDAPMESADNPATEHDSEFDFDAIFGDSVMDTAGDNQGDVDMDASGPDLNFTLDDSAPSLLRGLEDFAKSSDDGNANANASTNMDLDFAMPDLPDTAGNTSSEQPGTTKPADSTQQATDTSNDMLDTMATDDLDDLFNMDYENPEATQFDDAFFGFGES